MDKKTLLLAQAMITLMMAVTMSGVMSAIGMGLSEDWLRAWPRQALIAWPIAFAFTQVYGRLGFALALRLRAGR